MQEVQALKVKAEEMKLQVEFITLWQLNPPAAMIGKGSSNMLDCEFEPNSTLKN